MKIGKKLLAVAITLIMIMQLVPMSLFAASLMQGMNNADFTSTVSNDSGDVTVNVIGDCSITADVGIYASGDVTIQGTGTLTIVSTDGSAIYSGGTVTIYDGVTVIIESSTEYGIYAEEDVKIFESTVDITSNWCTIYSGYGSTDGIVIRNSDVTATSVYDASLVSEWGIQITDESVVDTTGQYCAVLTWAEINIADSEVYAYAEADTVIFGYDISISGKSIVEAEAGSDEYMAVYASTLSNAYDKNGETTNKPTTDPENAITIDSSLYVVGGTLACSEWQNYDPGDIADNMYMYESVCTFVADGDESFDFDWEWINYEFYDELVMTNGNAVSSILITYVTPDSEIDKTTAGTASEELNVTIGDGAGEVVFTEDERSGESSLEIKLTIDETDLDSLDTEVKEAIEAVIAAYEDDLITALVFDITLEKIIAGEAEAVTILENGSIRITIDIPEEYQAEGREFVMLREHDGEIEVLEDLDDDDATFTFETDRFCAYTLTYVNTSSTSTDDGDTDTDTEADSDLADTGATDISFVVGLMMASLAMVVVAKRKRA